MDFAIKHGTALVINRNVSVFLPSHLSYSSGNHCLSLSYQAKFCWPVADSIFVLSLSDRVSVTVSRLFLNSLQCYAGWESLVLTHSVNKVSSLHCPDEFHSLADSPLFRSMKKVMH